MNIRHPAALSTGLLKLFSRKIMAGRSVEAVAEEYLCACRAKIKRSTCSTYATTLSRHILPQFGHRPISGICREEINDFLYAKAFPEEGEALSAATVRVIVSVLRSLFQFAAGLGEEVVAWESISRPTLPGGETRVLSESEQQRLRDYLCRDLSPQKLGVLISMYTGLRIGEICAMRWGDVDLERGTMSIRRTVQRIRNLDYREGSGQSRTKVIFDVPKSRSGQRCIPIPSFLLEIMRTQRRPEGCYILTGSADSFLEPRAFQNRYRSLLRDAGIEYINFHALRHTFATNCVNLGFDVKTLSEILGHSNVSVTLNTYVHPSVSVMRSYMERLQ